jgi:hypothetical protein
MLHLLAPVLHWVVLQVLRLQGLLLVLLLLLVELVLMRQG